MSGAKPPSDAYGCLCVVSGILAAVNFAVCGVVATRSVWTLLHSESPWLVVYVVALLGSLLLIPLVFLIAFWQKRQGGMSTRDIGVLAAINLISVVAWVVLIVVEGSRYH